LYLGKYKTLPGVRISLPAECRAKKKRVMANVSFHIYQPRNKHTALAVSFRSQFILRFTLIYVSHTSRFWWDSSDFESCVPCPTWMYGGSHICTAIQNFWITLINRSKVFAALVSLSFVHRLCLDICILPL